MGVEKDVTMIGVTDSLRGPIPGLAINAALPRSVLGVLPGGTGELVATALVAGVLGRVVRLVRPTLIVFHNSTLAWPAVACARRTGARSAFVVQGLIQDRIESGANPYGRAMTRTYQRANAYALREADRVICISKYIASRALGAGVEPARLRIAPNVIDLQRFGGEPAVRDIDVLFVGRLSVEKGVDVLIRAVAGISASRRVVVVGDGPERPRLEALAARLGARVEFLGWRSEADLPALFARAQLQVAPSRSEPQGVVVVEALAAGTPVIGSRVGGIVEAIRSAENGWLVAPDDPEALRAAIDQALADRPGLESMRDVARRSVAHYGVESLTRNFAQTYL